MDHHFITPNAGTGHVYFRCDSLVDGEFGDLDVETSVRYFEEPFVRGIREHEEEGGEGLQASTSPRARRSSYHSENVIRNCVE